MSKKIKRVLLIVWRWLLLPATHFRVFSNKTTRLCLSCGQEQAKVGTVLGFIQKWQHVGAVRGHECDCHEHTRFADSGIDKVI